MKNSSNHGWLIIVVGDVHIYNLIYRPNREHCKKIYNLGPPAGIEPTPLRFRCSALTIKLRSSCCEIGMKLLYIYNVLRLLRLNEHFMLMHSRVYNRCIWIYAVNVMNCTITFFNTVIYFSTLENSVINGQRKYYLCSMDK